MAKRKMPTQRSLEFCRAQKGWCPQVVERWITIPRHPGGGKRKDFFGVIDIICVKIGQCNVGIQSTSRTNHSSHVAKAMAEPGLIIWLSIECNKFELWSWGKKQVGNRERWTLKIEAFYLDESGLIQSHGAHMPRLPEEIANDPDISN